MKSFQDLQFKPHPLTTGIQAKMFFDNGYGISVVRFMMGQSGVYGSYTDNESEFEVGVLRGTPGHWEICYDTPITENVLGHLLADGVTDVMKKIQELPPAELP